ncbi:MAG: hypothetical protein LBQ92_04650 [Propionibacteriaceae bacterium]|jgi:Trk K+ transport system NAD-binding subunit|nr:hypothetical protein [Propionibacteriaceae bacterium]
MGKPAFKARARYWFDNVMAKGTISLVALLFLFTAAVVILAGLLSLLFAPGVSLAELLWVSFNRTLDPGTLSGDTGHPGYITLLTIVTLFGVLVTSVLIGIINTGIGDRLDSLRKGRSQVLEKNHIVVLGFNEAAFTILSELITANENQSGEVVVVMDTEPTDEMEDAIRARVPDWKTTRIICRTGRIESPADLEICSLPTARSIIINTENDFAAMKTLLAISSILKSAEDSKAYVTAVIHNKENLTAARIAGGDFTEIVHFESVAARIMAHAGRQPGLASIFTELFDYGGCEIYIEDTPEILVGRTMSETCLYFPESTVIGIAHDGLTCVNPPGDTVIQPADQLILVAEDDGTSIPTAAPAAFDSSQFADLAPATVKPQHLLVLGCNQLIDEVLAEEDKYLAPGSRITVAAPVVDEVALTQLTLENITLELRTCDIYERRVLSELLAQRPENVLILTAPELDDEDADARTLVLLLLLRDIAEKSQASFTITSEMRSVENQELAKANRVNDFVVSSHLASLIMCQLSQTRELAPVFEDLLDEEGSELYLKPASRYVKLGEPVGMFTAAAAAARFDEVFLGYRTVTADGGFDIVFNPVKSRQREFEPTDAFIVVAED